MTTLLLLLFAPGYLSDMPPDHSGTYEAVALTASPWYRADRYVERVEGRRAAYKRARWLALQLDWVTASREVGVMWQVRQIPA